MRTNYPLPLANSSRGADCFPDWLGVHRVLSHVVLYAPHHMVS